MKILIADDDSISRRLLQRRLEKWGHEVVEASNGGEAWRLFNEQNFSIVITDWMMPVMDGVELIRKIRSFEHNSYVYCILLTAKRQKEDLVAGMEAGADDFLSKPFDAEELKVRLRAGERLVELENRLAQRNKELEYTNLRMRKDLEAAAQIQKSLLPMRIPGIQGVRLAWYFKPCEELAGDTFNFFYLNKDNLGIYILDVSGHGVSAALWSVMLNRMLSPDPDHSNLLMTKSGSSSGPTIVSPAEVANQLNRQFPVELSSGQFFTLLYGILNLRSRSFRFITAGHPSLVYLPAHEEPRVIETIGFPIGFKDDERYEEHTIMLHPGDRIFLYSDGLIEAQNKNDQFFGKENLLVSLSKTGSISLQQQVDLLFEELAAWNGRTSFDDDVTAVAFEISE